MDDKKKQLVKLATEKFGEILPVGTKDTLEECFTILEGELTFWFNDKNDSSHILRECHLSSKKEHPYE